MSDSKPRDPGAEGLPGAEDVPDVVVKARRGPSIVWIVPIVAAVIGGWLWYAAEQEKGPTITISMVTADDIETGKTRVKFKNVDVGEVEHIEIAQGLAGVVITVQMNHRATPYLREATRFWVVRPRIGARGISGLGTLVSGAYIEMEPSDTGALRTDFVGLEEPPVAPLDAPGLTLQLDAKDLGSLDVGSGIYFRGIQVGAVESQHLAPDAQGVDVQVYIEPQFAPLVRRSTRFWNASGLQASLGADGVEMNVQSLDALIRGGIAFETPELELAAEPARSGDTFALSTNRTLAMQKKDGEFVKLVMFFTGSVRGLAVGAPVEFRGIKIGSVTEFGLDYDADTAETRIPVVCTLERGIARRTDRGAPEKPGDEMKRLIEHGLRARLSTGSLLTGALFVDLDLFPDTPITLLGGTDLVEMPTLPSTTETVTNSLNQLSGIVADLHSMVQRVGDATPTFIASVEQTSAAIQSTLSQATGTLQKFESLAHESAQLRAPLEATLVELGNSLRSLRQLTDMLERHPEALIQGKPAGDDR